MYTHNFTFDLRNELFKKPSDGEAASVSNGITTQQQLTIKQFVDLVVATDKKGAYSFSTGYFNGKRNAKNWVGGNSAWFLDFDTNIPINFVLNSFSDLGIRVNVIYASFSDKPEYRKYRVGIFTTAKIETIDAFKHIQLRLMKVVQYVNSENFLCEADKSCKDCSRFYYPGKELIYLDEVENDFDVFLQSVNVIDAVTATDKKIKTQPQTPRTLKTVSINKKEINTIEYAKFNDGKHIEHFNWEKCLESVEIVRKFENLELLVCDGLHEEILNLAIFYSKIKGGLLRMKNVMLNFNKKYKGQTTLYNGDVVNQEYKANKFGCLTSCASYWYSPTSLNNFSKYGNDKNVNMNIFTYLSEKITKIESFDRISLKDAETKFKNEFERFANENVKVDCKDFTSFDFLNFFVPQYQDTVEFFNDYIKIFNGDINFFNCVTGLGKTEFILNLRGAFVVAFPTNALKNEAFERFKTKNGENVKVCKTPDLPIFSKPIQDFLDILYANDLHTEATAFIFMLGRQQDENVEDTQDSDEDLDKLFSSPVYFSQIEKLNCTEADIYAAHKYRNELIAAYMAKDCVVFTTHAKATIINFSNSSAIVFDEDPFDSFYKLQQFDADDLQLFIDNADDDDTENALKEFQNFLRMVGLYCAKRMPQKTEWFVENFKKIKKFSKQIKQINKKEVVKSKKTKLLAFLNCFNFVFDDKQEVVNDKRQKRTSNEPLKMFEFCTVASFDHFKNKNVAILSATTDVSMWKTAFPQHIVKVVDILDVEKVGLVSQYCGVSLTRKNLQNIIANKLQSKKDNVDMKMFDVFEAVEDLPTITFKDYKTFFKNPTTEMHLGNCCGFDSLKGQDIAVVGAYNRPSFVYTLIGQAIGLKVTKSNSKMEYLSIIYNGFKFSWVSFKNEDLKNVQCYFLNRETVQAVGRARTLRFNCSVNLIGGFPIREVDVITSQKFQLFRTAKFEQKSKDVLKKSDENNNIF